MESSSDGTTMIQQQMIEAYDQSQTLRMEFMQRVADLSNNPQNMNIFQKEKMISQLRLLTLDEDPSIQHNAVLTLGHLVDHSEELATIAMKKNILRQLVQSIPSQNRHYKKAAAFVLRAVAKHSPELSQAVVDCGWIDALVLCLGAVDPEVKESAARALGNIAEQNAILSQAVVDRGGWDALAICSKDFVPEVKEAAAWALGNFAQQNEILSQAVVDSDAASLLLSLNTSELAREEVNAGTIALLGQMIRSPDAKLKRQVLSTLIQISKHSVELAEMVITADIFSEVMVCLQDPNDYVKKDVITLMWEVVKHGAELSQVIVNCGGLAEVVDYLDKSCGSMRLPGIMMLGCVASHSENLAMPVILSKGVHQLAVCLSGEDEDYIKAATVWSIGQIGHHTPEHAEAVATAGLLPKVLQLYTGASSSDDLRLKSKKALKDILLKCTHLPSLALLLDNAPSNILNRVLGQFSKVLPHDSKARQEFLKSGGLRKVQEMDAEPDSALSKHIIAIKNCFPEAPPNPLKDKLSNEKAQGPQAETQRSPLPHTQPSKLQGSGTQRSPPLLQKPTSNPPTSTYTPTSIHALTFNPTGRPKEPAIRDSSRRAKTQHTMLPPRTPASTSNHPHKPIHAPTPNPRGGPKEPAIRDPSRRAKTQHTLLPPRTPATRTPASTSNQLPKPIHAPTPNPRGGPREPPIRDLSRRAKTQNTPLPPRTPTPRTPR